MEDGWVSAGARGLHNIQKGAYLLEAVVVGVVVLPDLVLEHVEGLQQGLARSGGP